MGKPYSVDLRRRVVAAIEAGMSRNQAVWGRDQHGDWLDAADRQCCSRQMGGHKGSVQNLSHIHSCDGFGFR
jgi:hypothetical protein